MSGMNKKKFFEILELFKKVGKVSVSHHGYGVAGDFSGASVYVDGKGVPEKDKEGNILYGMDKALGIKGRVQVFYLSRQRGIKRYESIGKFADRIETTKNRFDRWLREWEAKQSIREFEERIEDECRKEKEL